MEWSSLLPRSSTAEKSCTFLFLGATVVLPCRLSSETNLTWTREGGEIPERANQLNNMLRIKNVQVEDSGKYVCNGGGRKQYVTLMVESKNKQHPRHNDKFNILLGVVVNTDKPSIEITASKERPQPGFLPLIRFRVWLLKN